jgi:Tfp pilus assembly protein PilF
VELETLRQIESLASLSRRQLVRVGRRLVWRRYAPGDVILPHQVQLDLEGLVYQGKVQVAAVQGGRWQVVGYIHSGEPIHTRPGDRYSSPVELRALEPTTLCLVPSGHQPSPSSRARPRSLFSAVLSDVRVATRGTDRMLLGVLLILSVVLLGVGAWYWQAPWRAVLSNLSYGLASRHLQAGDEVKALSLLQTSLDLDPYLARAHNDLGYIHYRQGRQAEAQAAFRQAIASDPTLAVAHNNLGLSYLEQGRLDLAQEALRRALALNPESGAAWMNLGVTEQRAGRPEEATRAYRAALRLDSQLTAAQINLGVLFYEQRRFDEAQRYLELALDAQPDLPRARATLGAIALSQGDRERAWRELGAASGLADDPLLHFYLALWYEEAGLGEKAAQELETVLALRPHPELAALVRSHLVVLGSFDPMRQIPFTEVTDKKGE